MAQKQRISRRSMVRTAGTAIAAGAALATGMVARTARADAKDDSLVGTWIVTSTRAGSVPNGILVTVLPDGGFLRTGNCRERQQRRTSDSEANERLAAQRDAAWRP